jgi:hypothetical protein
LACGYSKFDKLIESSREATMSAMANYHCKVDLLLEKLFLALGILFSILLERLVLDQTHIGTTSSARSSKQGRAGLTEASSKSWW